MEELCIKYGLDKNPPTHNYLKVYEELFNYKRFCISSLLEIGLGVNGFSLWNTKKNFKEGNSVFFWNEYFPNANIYGIDIEFDSLALSIQEEAFYRGLSRSYITQNYLDNEINNKVDKVFTYICDQNNSNNLTDLMKKIGNVDIIIDDGSHVYEHQVTSLQTLIKCINPGGYYIIEDVFTDNKNKLYNLDDIPDDIKMYINNHFKKTVIFDHCTINITHQYILIFEYIL